MDSGSENPNLQQIAIIVPTLNAAEHWAEFHAGLERQRIHPKQVWITDSSSTDGTPDLVAAAGYHLLTLARADFNHGRTRQWAADQVGNAEILVFLTQDAVAADSDSIEKLIKPFSDPTIGATYGRQMPRNEAGPLEAHARMFNYPGSSRVKTWEDRQEMGIRATFLSNSFAAYRRTALNAVGGFPSNTIFAEDAIVAARLLMANWKIAYVAEAAVVHSHPYTARQEFARYFDIGVYHSREAWMLETFGTAGGEGKKFVLSELRHLGLRHAYLMPSALLRTLAKAAGYYLGRNEAKLSLKIRRRLSMHKRFWDSEVHK